MDRKVESIFLTQYFQAGGLWVKSGLEKFGDQLFYSKLKSVFSSGYFLKIARQVENEILKFNFLTFLRQLKTFLSSKYFSKSSKFTPQIRLKTHLLRCILRENKISLSFIKFCKIEVGKMELLK